MERPRWSGQHPTIPSEPLALPLDVVAKRPVPIVGPYTGAPMTRSPFNEQIINVRADGGRARDIDEESISDFQHVSPMLIPMLCEAAN